jgi:hypothetical protein
MLNEQQMTDTLAFNAYKAMEYEVLCGKLDVLNKTLTEKLQLSQKELGEARDILQRPDESADLRSTNAILQATNDRFSKALRCIGYVEGGERSSSAIARKALDPYMPFAGE